MFNFFKSKKESFETPKESSKRNESTGEANTPKFDNSNKGNVASSEVDKVTKGNEPEQLLDSIFGQETPKQEKNLQPPCSIDDLQRNLGQTEDSTKTSQNEVKNDSKVTLQIDSKPEESEEKTENDFYINFEVNPYWDNLNHPTQEVFSGNDLPKSQKSSKKTKYPSNSGANKKDYFFYKPTVDKKLTIILLENTNMVAKEKDKLLKIINGLVTAGMICIINYGNDVIQSEIFEVSEIKDMPVLNEKDIGDISKLFDALIETEKLVSKKYLKTEENEKQKVRFNEIEIIGIGTCKDCGSKSSKDDGINAFCKIIQISKITTKYFCLTEQSFLDAAEIGFHSIGAINRIY